MREFSKEDGRIKINMKTLMIGDDLCVIISGGDSPHVGAVALSVPRPSLKHPNVNSASTSVLTLIGHKDDELAKQVSQELASKLNRNVITTCGIHLDNITTEELNVVVSIVMESVKAIVNYFT
ncbi:MAG: proteasome assembly chaperone 4 family protein [Ruminiclostridium sp.]